MQETRYKELGIGNLELGSKLQLITGNLKETRYKELGIGSKLATHNWELKTTNY
jgi:hypothetical protein